MSKCNNKLDRQVFTDGLGERAKKRIVSSIQPDLPAEKLLCLLSNTLDKFNESKTLSTTSNSTAPCTGKSA